MIQLPNNHIGVEVSEDANDFTIDEIISPYVQYWEGEEDTVIDLPPGQWEIVGLSDELTEEQWKGICEEATNEYYTGGKDYTGEVSAFHSFTESGLSLLKSLGQSRLLILKPSTPTIKQ